LRKTHISIFAVLIYWKFAEIIKKPVPRIPFSLSDLVCCLTDPWMSSLTL